MNKRIEEGLRHGRRTFDLSFLDGVSVEEVKAEYEQRNYRVIVTENAITFKEKGERKLLHG